MRSWLAEKDLSITAIPRVRAQAFHHTLSDEPCTPGTPLRYVNQGSKKRKLRVEERWRKRPVWLYCKSPYWVIIAECATASALSQNDLTVTSIWCHLPCINPTVASGGGHICNLQFTNLWPCPKMPEITTIHLASRHNPSLNLNSGTQLFKSHL